MKINKQIESLKSDIEYFYKCEGELKQELVKCVSLKFKGIMMELTRLHKLQLLDPLINWIINRGEDNANKAKTMCDIIGEPLGLTWKDFIN